MKSHFLVACMVLWRGTSPAQWDLSWSGYVVDIPAYQMAAGAPGTENRQWVNVSRLRLRPALSLWSESQLSMEYEVAAFYHSAPSGLAEEEPLNQRVIVDMRWSPASSSHGRLTHSIDRLHLKQGFAFGEATLGRQRVAWGSGRVWNPTDLFNPVNRTDYAKIEKDGIDALTVKVSPGSFTDVTLVVNPLRGWTGADAGCRIRTNVREFDLSVVAGVFDRHAAFGGDVAGNFFGAGIRGEFLRTSSVGAQGETFVRFILGVDYQITATTYSLVEYLHNGEGNLDRRLYDLRRLARGEILNCARDYLAVGGSWQVHPLVLVSATHTANLNDGSSFFIVSAAYSLTEELVIAAGGQVFRGTDFSEYWHYPSTLFLKADVYF